MTGLSVLLVLAIVENFGGADSNTYGKTNIFVPQFKYLSV